MHWIAFTILVYVVTVLQTTLAPFIAVHTIRPDLIVIVAVHYALLARNNDALIACWLIGLAIDLTGLSYSHSGYANVGINAFCLGLLAMLIVKTRELTFRESALTQLAVTFLVKLSLGVLVGIHMLYALDQLDRLGDILTTSFWAAVYTAALAPYLNWALRRLRAPLGIGVTHRLRVR